MIELLRKTKNFLENIVTTAIILFTISTIIMVALQMIGLILGKGAFITGVYNSMFKAITFVSCITGFVSYMTMLLRDYLIKLDTPKEKEQ